MFLHITTHIPKHKDDDLLGKFGSRSFPTILALSSKGEVMAKPRRRSLQAFEAAMDEAAELEGELAPKAKPGTEKDSAAYAMEILRKVKLGALVNPEADRAAYIKARPSLTPQQRKDIERALIMSELTKAQAAGMRAELGTPESDRAMLTMLAAKEKLGGKWPIEARMNRVLITLMRWAEHRSDPQLYESLFVSFVAVRRKAYGDRATNEGFIESFKDRLDRLWKGQGPTEKPRPVRRR